MAELPDVTVDVVPPKVTPYSKWVNIIKDMVFHTQGVGASSTKGAYLIVAIAIAFCLVTMTMTFNWVYWKWHKADYVFATALGAMTVAVVGFVANAQNTKTKIGATNADPTSKPDTAS